MSEYEMVLRLGVAALAGAVLGIDRELRGGAAGIRTNGMVGLSSAAITASFHATGPLQGPQQFWL